MAVDEYGQHRGPYGTEFRESVWELWAFYCGQDEQKVVRMLTDDPVWREAVGLEDGEAPPTAKTIRKWAEINQWHWKATQRMREAYPTAIRYATLQMAMAIQPAAKLITEALTSEEKIDSSTKARLENAWKVWDTVVGTSVSDHLRASVQDSMEIPPNLKDMSLDQLADAERRMLGS